MKRLLGGIALAILVVFGFTASFQRPDSWISQGKPIPNTVGKFNPAGNGPSKPLDMLVPPPADASTFRSRWVFTGPVNWRTNRDGRAIDSTTVVANNTAAAHSATAQSDTTAPFLLSECPIPTRPVSAGTTVVDSVTWFGFYVGAAGAAPTADSIYVGQQVSIDGVSWVTVSNTQTFFAADAQITGKPPIASASIIEPTAGNSFGRMYDINESIVGQHQTSFALAAATLPNDGQMTGWRYIRWIVTWSIVDGASTFQAWVGHWED